VKQTWTWVILIGGGYGAFLFEGCANAAEERRATKCQWEHAVGRKRLATEEEILSGAASNCWNHPNFHGKYWYHCECGECDNKARRRVSTPMENSQ
jgi:hypothetical protein